MAREGALGGLASVAHEGVRPRRWYTSFLRDRFALLGAAVLLALALVAVFAPRLAPYDPPQANDIRFFLNRLAPAHSPPFWDRRGDVEQEVSIFEEQYLPYDPQYPLGTDWERRDMASLLAYGTRFSLAMGLLAVVLVAVSGAALGLLAGWRGGRWEQLVMRGADVADAVPALLAYILFAAVASGTLARALSAVGLHLNAVPVTALALSCVGWVPVARLVRGQVQAIRGSEWVLAARATGVPDGRIALRHVLPHTLGPALVAASAQLPALLLADGLLGAINVGPRPSVDSLGELIFHQFAHTVEAPIFVLMPTALLLAMALAVTALSDGIQRAFDPRSVR